MKKNRRKRLLQIFAGFVLAVSVGLSIHKNNSSKMAVVSAHPTAAILLDAGGSNEFGIPVDGTSIIESALSSNTGYVQGTDVVPVLLKNKIETMASDFIEGNSVTWGIRSVEKTNYGHYVVLFGASGNGRGGMIKVSVYDKNGVELVTDIQGTLLNTSLRVLAPFYNAGNNNYLVGTTNDSFYRYTISGESASSATITKTLLTTPNINYKDLKIHQILKVNTFSVYSDDSVITGAIYPSAGEEGYVKNRVPIGAIKTNGWLSTGFTSSLSYMYSLENLSVSEVGLSTGKSEFVNPADFHMDTAGNLYGVISYSNADQTQRIHSLQIFSQTNVTDAATGAQLKKREYVYKGSQVKELTILRELCTTDDMYFLSRDATETKLMKVDLHTYEEEVVKIYPKDTTFNLFDNGDGTLAYYGSTTSLTGEFYSPYYTDVLSSSYYFVQGIMSDKDAANPFAIKSTRAFETSGVVQPTHVLKSSSTKLFIAGVTYDFASFTDSLYLIDVTGGFTSGTPSAAGAFVGTLDIKDDYAPIIKETDNILINLSDPVIKSTTTNSYNWTPLENWLITGTKTGTPADALAISGYDYFDSNDTAIGATAAERQKWLDMRINRNPKDSNAAIDWKTLGFDKTVTGPQQVTYFVTDTQSQVSSTSRWVNKVTDQTIITDDKLAALDAQNFAVPLDTVSAAIPDEEAFKALAKTMAWNLEDHEVYEDGAAGEFDSYVTVDQTQLAALQNATEAKPYPVDVSFRAPTAGDGSVGAGDGGSGLPGDDGPPGGGTTDPGQVGSAGQTITNRVWVFVTTKNTVVDTDTGIVIYGDDYTLPLYLAAEETMNDVYTTGNIRVYDYYDNTHETDADCIIENGKAELPALADKNNTTGLTITNMEVINDATESCVVQPEIAYTTAEGTVTTGTIDVTITGTILLHVRQVIIRENAELTVPTEGYLQLDNASGDRVNLAVPSGIEDSSPANQPDFKSFTINVTKDSSGSYLNAEVIVPEYYKYAGYVVSDTQLPIHSSSALTGTGMYQYDLADGEYEKWLTVYIKPTAVSPGEYSWAYKTNELTTITTK